MHVTRQHLKAGSMGLALTLTASALLWRSWPLANPPVLTEAPESRAPASEPAPPTNPSDDPTAQGDRSHGGQDDERPADQTIGPWQLRVVPSADPLANPGGLTITGPSPAPIQVPGLVTIDPLSGSDIDGDGQPEAILHSYSGGAHCCFQLHIYRLSAEHAELILRTPQSNCDSRFEDLDADGLPEILTCDDSLAYAFCPFVDSPMPQVILRWQPEQGYLPSGPEMPQTYAARIVDIETRLNQVSAQAEPPELRCAALGLALELGYAGRWAEGWSRLEEQLGVEEGNRLRQETEAYLEESAYYRGPGDSARPVMAPP